MAWIKKKLGEVCIIINGRNQKDVIDENGQYPIFGSAGNLMGYANKYLCDKGTVIIGRKGNISKPIFIDEPFWNVDTAFGIYPKEKAMIPKFNYYLCLNIDFKSRNKGTTIPSLVKTDLMTINLLVNDSVVEQQAIVEKLDFAFDAIEKAKANIEKNIENAKELFQSKLNDIFSQKGEGWEEKTLEKISTIVNGYAFSSTDFSTENEVKSIKITNVGVKEFVFDDANNLPISFLEKNKNVLVNEGDIVMALTRTIIAAGLKVAIVPKEYNLSLLNQRVVAIKESKHLSTQFLYYFLSSTIAKDYVLNHVNTLMQPNLSINDLKNMPISLPSIEHQQILVTKLDELSSQTNFLKEKYKHKLANLEELKKSILEKAFKGQL